MSAAGIQAGAPVSDQAFSFGVIGDIPYGAAEIAKFPARIKDINADPGLKFVAHVGDIKNGSSICSDEHFQHIDPSSITSSTRWSSPPATTNGSTATARTTAPTTCLERLDKLRQVFFTNPVDPR